MKKVEKMKKNVKGITLIALVVTIIVLLILAGIAINLTIGNNGIFSRAQNAANTWRQAEANEQAEMKNFEDLYDETINNLGLNGGSGSQNPLTKITGSETTKTDTTDKAGNRIVVPAGFKVVNPEATVNEGIVIEDVSANNSNTVGNQFVWIPCTIDGANGSLKYDRYAFTREDPVWDYRQTKLNEKDADGSYKIKRQNDIDNNRNYYYHEAISELEKQTVAANGGYYIGRYEVGVDSERNSSSKENIEAVARVKANMPVYNYVTRDEAVTIAERMYVGKSKLCSSYAWDTVLKYIDGENGTYAVNSEGDNNRTTSSSSKLENTGYHAEKNIYDMGGNVYEWTTENCAYSSNPCVLRGGHFSSSSLGGPASIRNYSYISYSNDFTGLRVTLYI